jgi:hypothetical protein
MGAGDRSPERTDKNKEDGRSTCESKNNGFPREMRFEK